MGELKLLPVWGGEAWAIRDVNEYRTKAPDVTKIGDTYYLYYSVSQFGSQNSALGLATSKTMDVGSWQDRGAIGVNSNAGKNYNAIDANLFRGGNKWYMNFG